MTMTEKQTDHLAAAIRSIAHGTESGPTGLEMLAMAIGGDGLGSPLGPAVEMLASAVAEADALAAAVTELAATLWQVRPWMPLPPGATIVGEGWELPVVALRYHGGDVGPEGAEPLTVTGRWLQLSGAQALALPEQA